MPRRPWLARGGVSPCSPAFGGLRVAAIPRCKQRALASLHPARPRGKEMRGRIKLGPLPRRRMRCSGPNSLLKGRRKPAADI